MSSATVIIPVLGPAPELERLLAAIADLESTVLREVIVVDNTDTASSEVRATVERSVVGADRLVRLIHEPRGYSYAARNAGIASAGTEYLAFLDVDVVPEAAFGPALDRLVASGRPERFTGPINQFVERSSRLPWDRCAQAFDLIYGLHQKSYVAGGWAATANLVVHRTAIEVIGAFDARLESSGDLVWGRRAEAHGIPLKYVEELAVRHEARRTLRALAKKHHRVGVGQGRLLVELGADEFATLTGGPRHPMWPLGGYARRFHRLLSGTGFPDRPLKQRVAAAAVTPLLGVATWVGFRSGIRRYG